MNKNNKNKLKKNVTTKTVVTTTKRKSKKAKNPQGGQLSSAPVAMGRKTRMGKPMMNTSSNGNCRIRHREYIGDLTAESTSPSLFKVTGFPINPGMVTTFPWLSQIAPRFEKFRFDRLHFQYETEAPTSLGGSLILTVDYDATDNAPLSKVQAMAYKNAVRSPPWEECVHISAKEDLSQQKQYFVRAGAIPSNSDIKLYDVGNLFVCSQNVMTGGATLGELYVDYDVELITPQYQLPSVSGSGSMLIESNSGQTPSNLFGTNPDVRSSGNLPFSDDVVTSELTCLVAGNYSFSLYVTGTVLTGLAWSGSRGSDVSNAMSAAIIDSTGVFLASTAVNGIQIDIGDTIRFTATATTVTSAQLLISVCNPF